MDPSISNEYPRLRPIDVFGAEVEGRPVLGLRDPLRYADGVIYLPRQAAAILQLLDGRHSLQDIQLAYARQFGTLLFREKLESMVEALDRQLLLDSPRFTARLSELEADFRRALTRPAQLAGLSYPDEPETLGRQLEGYFLDADGPGTREPSPEAARLVGLVVPHIDFGRGGPCYAWGFREAAGAPPPDRWVVLGTVHQPITRPYALTRKDFETPLGTVEADQEFLGQLLRRTGQSYLDDEFAHRAEHSIEFQAVFLRHQARRPGPIRMVPILCGSLHAAVERQESPGVSGEVATFLGALRETLVAVGGRTVVLASADLAHVGPMFGDREPAGGGRLREVAEADARLLTSVEAGDAEGFFREVTRDGDSRRICGLPPIYAALSLLPGARGRLLRYGQWPDPAGAVTFAALAMYAAESRA